MAPTAVPFAFMMMFRGPFWQKGPQKWSHDNGSNRGPFWQKGPQGVRRPRAFWPECFGQALPRSLLAKGTTRGPPAESLAAKCSKNVLNF